jgi:hypothetical protein
MSQRGRTWPYSDHRFRRPGGVRSLHPLARSGLPRRSQAGEVADIGGRVVAAVRVRPSTRQIQRAEQPVDGRDRTGVVPVPRPRLGAVVPMMEERRGNDSFQPPEAAADVGVDQQTLDALDGEVTDDRRSGEAEHQNRQRRREPGERHVDRVSSIWGQPVHLAGGVMHLVESPERWNLVAQPVTPVAAHLRDDESLCPTEPNGLHREVPRDLAWQGNSGERESNDERGSEAESSKDLVDDEAGGIGRGSCPTHRRWLRSQRSPSLDEGEAPPEHDERGSDVGSPPDRPGHQRARDEDRPTEPRSSWRARRRVPLLGSLHDAGRPTA